MPTNFTASLSLTKPVEQAWELLVDAPLTLEDHPSVRSLEVVSSSASTRRSTWELLLRGSVLHATIDEAIDPGAHRVAMSLVEGDLTTLSGTWVVEAGASPSDCVVEATLVATFGLPMVGDVIDAHLDVVLRDLVDAAGRRLQGDPVPQA